MAVEVSGLRKSYGPVEAVRGVDLQVSVGEVFALLGPNGAGKTTTVEILEGHRRRSSGSVSVLGHDPERGEREYRSRIGIVLQETGVEPYLTVAEAVELYRGYYPTPRRLDEVLELVGLQQERDARVNKLSGGQHRRLDVAIGLAGDPELLFLDEPTTGFDPSARRNAWEMVKSLASLGKTVVLTTHYMDEAQYLADRVAILVDGRIVAEGPPSELGEADSGLSRITFRLPAGAPDLPADLSQGGSFDEDRIELRTTDATRALYDLTRWAVNHRLDLLGLAVTQPSLEDVYLQLTSEADSAT